MRIAFLAIGLAMLSMGVSCARHLSYTAKGVVTAFEPVAYEIDTLGDAAMAALAFHLETGRWPQTEAELRGALPDSDFGEGQYALETRSDGSLVIEHTVADPQVEGVGRIIVKQPTFEAPTSGPSSPLTPLP